MPSPSKAKLFTSLTATAIFFVTGAYAASSISPQTSLKGETVARGGYMPAPVPRMVEPVIKPVMPKIDEGIEVKQSQPSTQKKTSLTEVKQTEPALAKPSLTVTLGNIRSDHGNVIIMVFADAKSYETYDYTKAVGYKEIKAKSGLMTASFPELTGGPYVITLFHDENGDQDLNLQGEYPIEGYGTSNADGKYQTLDFNRASIMAGSVTVKVHYLD